MNFFRFSISICLPGMMGAAAMAATTASPVTFDKEILPILQKNCQGCHRPGEISPMSLLTYTDARPWAKAIKAAVLTRKMPPWFADSKIGHFANQMTLSDADINTLVSWVDHGAPEGNPKDKPAPLKFIDGWNIRPDLVVQMPKPFVVPAKGAINYKFFVVKTDFPEDMWVTDAEMRAGNTKVLHHGEVFVRPPGSHWMENAVPGEAYDYETNRDIMNRTGAKDEQLEAEILGKFNPGLGAQNFTVEGGAKFVPKGSDLVFEAHYTADGEATPDASRVALTLTKTPPTRRYFYTTGPMAQNLVIPAGDPNAEVVGEVTVMKDNVHLVYLQPHLHVRGKDLELLAIYPNGEKQSLLRVNWDFNWQQGYELKEPIPVPKGTRLIDIVHFDNSPNNPYNPDPAKEVLWGPQTWDEMTNVFLGLTIDLHEDTAGIFVKSGPSLLKRVTGVAGPTVSALDLPAPKGSH